eukprot:3359726-Rhodomonas_salina.1
MPQPLRLVLKWCTIAGPCVDTGVCSWPMSGANAGVCTWDRGFLARACGFFNMQTQQNADTVAVQCGPQAAARARKRRDFTRVVLTITWMAAQLADVPAEASKVSLRFCW